MDSLEIFVVNQHLHLFSKLLFVAEQLLVPGWHGYRVPGKAACVLHKTNN